MKDQAINETVMDILHKYGHDVPGFVSGELTRELDPITQMRVSCVILDMATDLKEAWEHIKKDGDNG